jgi:integrase
MSSRGNLQRKCVKGHPKTAGRCSSRCIRWYPRLELPRTPDGTRRFEALGGYPTRSQAEAALADALTRRSHGLALDLARLTVNEYLDRWLAHVRVSLRARTVARYAALLRDHVRPDIGARPLKQLTPLEIQAIYDRLAVSGRRDGKPGGLAPQHILAVHRCLHRALAQAVTWRLIARNAATHATPPPVPPTEAVALAPEQVMLLLDAADQSPSPWLGTWTVLAAATGARNGELCGLEWADLDLDASTVRFRQALTIIDPAVLPTADPNWTGRRRELAVGPVKSTASSAILTLPPFAAQALRQHHRQQARLRLALGQPATVPLRWVEPGRPPHPVELDLVFRTERGTPVNPNHASRAFARLAASAGLAAHPHLLRHALISVGDGGQQGTSQHHRRPAAPCRRRHARPAGVHPPAPPDRAPAGWGDRGRVRPSSAKWPGGVGWASGGGNVEGKPALEPDLTGRPATALLLVRGYVAGTGFEPV